VAVPAIPTSVQQALRSILQPLGALTGVERLTGGMFAVTYRGSLADGRRVIVKTAPSDDGRLLSYERDLIRTEALVYGLAADRPAMLMPRVLLTDFSRSVLPTDVVVASHLDGEPLLGRVTAAGEPAAEQPQLQLELGVVMSRIHEVTGGEFGYPSQSRLRAATWPAAFELIIGALLDDAERWSVEVPANEIRASLVRHRAALAEVVTPVLVHTDLWPGNLFVDPSTGRLNGVIDPERALWGDPLLDVAGADQLGQGPVPASLVAGYASGGRPLPIGTAAADSRLLLYRMFFALVQKVEMVPRDYQGSWVEEHRMRVERSLRHSLDSLD
jgi:aminoglycoside phosphotransferase (APT) family kinase protein